MLMTKRRNFSDKFKATLAFVALRGDKMVQEIATRQQLQPRQMSPWQRQAMECMTSLFPDKAKKAENKEGEIKAFHAKIG
ncbi:MAG: transposase [Paracoccaceae bacterium]|nr:transposase [Paracoccaceae bacterium]